MQGTAAHTRNSVHQKENEGKLCIAYPRHRSNATLCTYRTGGLKFKGQKKLKKKKRKREDGEGAAAAAGGAGLDTRHGT